MDTHQAILSKRDIRHYTDREVSDDVLERILQAGRMAGSAKNQEVNRLIVVRDLEVKRGLAKAGDFASWIDTAPVIIGFAAPSEGVRLFDVGRQAQNMMVAANAEGLATCPVTLGHQDQARQAVGLPDDWEMRMVITLGWPDPDRPESPLKRTRVPLSELVRHDRWS